jgi:membrane-bound lytic murein transglycosylase A
LFRPVLIEDGTPGLFTGYFEPELIASRSRTERFRYPIYRLPPEVPLQGKWFTRAEIEQGGLLENRDLEIGWLDDPVDRFFLQVQGSGRLKFTDGTSLRVGYGGTNGHEYRSVGVELARRGVMEPHRVSARAIRAWVDANPRDGAELLRHNPSYIFFAKSTTFRQIGVRLAR